MTIPANPAPVASDAKLIILAREIAADLRPLDDILKSLALTDDEFERVKAHPRFNELLEAAAMEWSSAGNTHERTRLKAAMMVEDWLVEAHTRLHDKAENLTAKTELAKLIAKLAGMGNDRPDGVAEGNKVNITINLGSEQLTFEHQVPPKVIDADPSTAA